MRLPDRFEILDYAENAAGQDANTQKRILQLLASSQILREHLAEVKRDLYMVGTQVPEYTPDAMFAAEVSKLSQTWFRTLYERRFSLRSFYRSREFYFFILGLLGTALLIQIGRAHV